MKDFKKEISKIIAKNVELSEEELYQFIEIPKDTTMGDYAFPCFKLAKQMHKAPQIIATELKEKLDFDDSDIIEKIEVAGGYLNFYLNKDSIVKEVVEEFSKKGDKFGSSKIGDNKKVVIDYSSPNIAKPFHIGHLRSTVIGASLYKIYEFLGYKCIGVNHLGDWGTQFGKLIEGYKRWGDEYDIDSNPIEELTKIYIRITNACKEDESILEDCRNNFKKLEDGDPYCKNLWGKFRAVSLKEFNRIYDLLGVKFDSFNGEAFYIDKMSEVIEMLDKSGKLVESQGAKIIDLDDKGMAPCMIVKSNGSTTYDTRDLAAILYRARTYDYDKILYVVAYEQNLHFKQIFEVAQLLDMDDKYKKNLEHVPFGMVRLKTGKMSTREGNVVKLEEILNESIARAKSIIEEKNPNLENKDDVAKKVGLGAVIFNDLSNNRIKDEIFDWDLMLNFNGETGPYVQYIYVRTKGILEKAGYIPKYEELNLKNITDDSSMNVIKLLYQFGDIVKMAADKNEPSIISRYLIDLAQSFSSFYTENHIIGEQKDVQDARLYLTNMVGTVLKQGLNLLGIEVPDKM